MLATMVSVAWLCPGQRGPQTPAAPPPATSEIAPQLCNDTANFLGGMKGRPDGPFRQLEDTDAWKNYAAQFDKSWENSRTKQFQAVDAFQKRELAPLHSGAKYLFYPFSGPDILYAQHFFPDARLMVFAARENVGDILPPETYQPANIAKELDGWRQGIKSIFDRTFFVTSEMDEQFHGKVHDGILPLMLLLLARNGNVIDYVRYGRITENGEFVPEAVTVARHHGVEIHYRHPSETQSRILYYIKTDLASPFKTDPSFSRFLTRLGRPDTLIKSASFLLHWAQFAAIREYILANSDLILQDDTGVPYKMLKPKEWQVQLYGEYSHPDKPFVNEWQTDLADAFKEPGRVKELGFVLGYGSRRRPSSMMLATRIAAPPPQAGN
ncbi:MAG TPA: hypothetical protein VKF41_07375 [Bryobacteraceae bacterium]|nr:hypothetical protein [Bryobacteraceae bacterium]